MDRVLRRKRKVYDGRQKKRDRFYRNAKRIKEFQRVKRQEEQLQHRRHLRAGQDLYDDALADDAPEERSVRRTRNADDGEPDEDVPPEEQDDDEEDDYDQSSDNDDDDDRVPESELPVHLVEQRRRREKMRGNVGRLHRALKEREQGLRAKEAALAAKEAREKELEKRKRAREAEHKRLSARTRRGQPVMRNMMEHLLGKLQAQAQAKGSSELAAPQKLRHTHSELRHTARTARQGRHKGKRRGKFDKPAPRRDGVQRSRKRTKKKRSE